MGLKRINMKTITTLAVGMLLVGLMSVAVSFRDDISSLFENSAEVIQIEKEEVIKEVTPDWATDIDAVEAAQAVIRRKELEAELKGLEAIVATTTARIEVIEKELGTF